jgi:hypothetical protein
LVNDWPLGETDNSYVLNAEVPGIPKENIEIRVKGNLLSVHAERKDDETLGVREYPQQYRSQYRRFHQEFRFTRATVQGDGQALKCAIRQGQKKLFFCPAISCSRKKVAVARKYATKYV